MIEKGSRAQQAAENRLRAQMRLMALSGLPSSEFERATATLIRGGPTWSAWINSLSADEAYAVGKVVALLAELWLPRGSDGVKAGDPA